MPRSIIVLLLAIFLGLGPYALEQYVPPRIETRPYSTTRATPAFLAGDTSAAVASSEIRFDRDLFFGMHNDPDVARLQEFLKTQGYFSYPIASGNYLRLTLDAVRKFQRANGLPAVGGYFGLTSRQVANRILSETRSQSGGATPPSSPSSPSTPGSSNRSPYKGKIFLGSVSGTSDRPDQEFVTIENRSPNETIPITDFRIENSNRDAFIIPRGYELPGSGSEPTDPIRLRPGDRAEINAGRQSRHMDFRENLCTGYFDQTDRFTPSLNHACPRQDTRYFFQFSDECLRAIDSIVACREPRELLFLPNECVEYINRHFSYAGCVRDYRNATNFYANRWLIWMQRDREFFRNVHEKITLKDPQGRVVDEQSY